MTDSEKSGSDWVELGPFTKAKRVKDSVLIKDRRGNLVQQIFIDEEDLAEIANLFGRSLHTGSEEDD